ncbi:uncharacterized protein LOC144576894 isoform X2 [Callithrix jacchus]
MGPRMSLLTQGPRKTPAWILIASISSHPPQPSLRAWTARERRLMPAQRRDLSRLQRPQHQLGGRRRRNTAFFPPAGVRPQTTPLSVHKENYSEPRPASPRCPQSPLAEADAQRLWQHPGQRPPALPASGSPLEALARLPPSHSDSSWRARSASQPHDSAPSLSPGFSSAAPSFIPTGLPLPQMLSGSRRFPESGLRRPSGPPRPF